MTERVKKLVEQARSLTTEERAELIDELTGEIPDETAKAWADEAVRRGDDAIASGNHGEPWETIRGRLLA